MSNTKKKKKAKIVLILLLFAAVGVCVLIFGFRVYQVQIMGNNYVSDESIESWVMKDVYMDNSIAAVLKNRERTDTPPMTESISVSLALPWKLKISVEENHAVGYYVQDKQKIYFDRDGYILVQTEELLDGTVRVTGLPEQEKNVGEKLEVDDPEVFGRISECVEAIKECKLTPAEIEVKDDEVLIVFGTIRVKVGDGDIRGKITQLPEILRMLGNETGVLHLEKYSSDSKSIWFEDAKNAKISVKSID